MCLNYAQLLKIITEKIDVNYVQYLSFFGV